VQIYKNFGASVEFVSRVQIGLYSTGFRQQFLQVLLNT
jgi:hypothetical protein